MIRFSIIACPPCQFDDHEVCVLPTNGSPHCECADGYVRDIYHKCVACVEGMVTRGVNSWGAIYIIVCFNGHFFDFVKLILISLMLL